MVRFACWSENGRHIVYALEAYEEGLESPGFGTPRRNERFQLRKRDSENENEVAVTEFISGRVEGQIFHHECRQQSIVNVTDGDFSIAYLFKNDAVKEIARVSRKEDCRSIRVVPSPFGRFLGVIETRNCLLKDPSSPVEPFISLKIRILDADDLEILFEYESDIKEAFFETAWAIDSKLLVNDSENQQKIDPVTGDIELIDPDNYCFSPQTTSSNISHDGRRLVVENSEISIIDSNYSSFACNRHSELLPFCD